MEGWPLLQGWPSIRRAPQTRREHSGTSPCLLLITALQAASCYQYSLPLQAVQPFHVFDLDSLNHFDLIKLETTSLQRQLAWNNKQRMKIRLQVGLIKQNAGRFVVIPLKTQSHREGRRAWRKAADAVWSFHVLLHVNQTCQVYHKPVLELCTSLGMIHCSL